MRFAVLLILCSLCLAADTKKKAAHKGLAAHEHGTAKLNIAVEGATAAIEFESPALGMLGFEHLARTAADKKKQEAALAVLKVRFPEMVALDPAIGCRFTPRKAAVIQEDGEDHSEVQADFSVVCAKPLPGTRIQFGFTKVFPGVHIVEVQVLNGQQQTGTRIQDDRGAIALSK